MTSQSKFQVVVESGNKSTITDVSRSSEVMVVLGTSAGSLAGQYSAYTKALSPFYISALERNHHYCTFHFGFIAKDHSKPFVVVEWKKLGVDALERRYVLQELHKVLFTQFSIRNVVFALLDGSAAEQMVQVEDFAMTQHSPFYDRPKFESLRVVTFDQIGLDTSDPIRNYRQKYQMQFRQWINEDADTLTSIEIGERLAAFCFEHGCNFESHDERSLKEKNLNLLLAVGQASQRSPSRLHIATYNVRDEADAKRALLLVGKGVTFDTGGINLKAHENFVNCMKNDMGGAALTAATFMALVESKWKQPLILAIPACENLIGELAVKPGAVIKSYRGKNVMIEHTDAEGRLILADAIGYAQDRFKPRHTVSAATLTTASLRQFTNFFTPVHFAPPQLVDALSRASQKYGDNFTFWSDFLPFLLGNKSPAADLTNMGRMPSHSSIGGGSNVAAHFLREFGGESFTHFDIFASTWNWSGDYPGAHYGATGAPFNAFLSAMSEFGT